MDPETSVFVMTVSNVVAIVALFATVKRHSVGDVGFSPAYFRFVLSFGRTTEAAI